MSMIILKLESFGIIGNQKEMEQKLYESCNIRVSYMNYMN